MKVAVLGGTFDPIHEAHLFMAREVIRRLGFHRVLLMVAPRPPHKQSRILTGAFHRYAMAVLASQHDDHVEVSGLELERPGPSYTIDTMVELRRRLPGAELAFIAGGDSLRELPQWHRYDRLISEFSLIFVPRHGSEINLAALSTGPTVGRVEVVEGDSTFQASPGRSCLLRIRTPEISSTWVRARLAAGFDPGPEVLHPEVLRYIRKYRLYGPSQETAATDL
jgi:nicotinate-nucleotide adenylyltransferase